MKRGTVIVYNRQLPRFVFLINRCIEKIHIQDTHVKKDAFNKDYLFVNCQVPFFFQHLHMQNKAYTLQLGTIPLSAIILLLSPCVYAVSSIL